MKKRQMVLAVTAALGLVLVFTVLSLKLDHITVSGNNRYTDEELIGRLFEKPSDRNTIYCYIKDRLKDHLSIPFVEDYSLVFKSLSELEIIVHEKSVVGYVSYMSSYMYFDKDGIVVESTSRKLPDIPEITGLKLGYIALYQKLPVENETIFQEILNLTQILSIHELVVDRVQYNSLGEATLYMGDIEVLLGGNADLNGKIGELNDMVPQLEGRKGTLHLENYDETSQGAGFAFTPRE